MDVFRLPCYSVFPANIGGMSAWIVIVKRGSASVMPMTAEDRLRVKKLASSRKRVEQSRAGAKIKEGLPTKERTGRSKYRRVQSS